MVLRRRPEELTRLGVPDGCCRYEGTKAANGGGSAGVGSARRLLSGLCLAALRASFTALRRLQLMPNPLQASYFVLKSHAFRVFSAVATSDNVVLC